jgi:hypothetical protein
MIRAAVVLAALAAVAPAPAIQPEIAKVLAQQLKFSPADLSELRNGTVVKHSVSTAAPGEIAVVGGVRVLAPMNRLVDGVRNIEEFKRGPEVLEIGRFSDPPAERDLDRLTVTPNDFDPDDCRVGDCDVRLSSDVIQRMPRDRVGSDGVVHQAEAERWFKQVLLEHVVAYWSGDSRRIMTYDADSRRIEPAKEFDGLLNNAPTLGALVPELPAHLSKFPSHRSERAEDFLYWSKEKFGLAPFITVTQVTIVCPSAQLCVIASKDVYSSRYIDASLAMTIASVDVADPGAFYLVYANRSRSSALKGMFAGIRKAIAERRARSGLEETLRALKARLEKR